MPGNEECHPGEGPGDDLCAVRLQKDARVLHQLGDVAGQHRPGHLGNGGAEHRGGFIGGHGRLLLLLLLLLVMMMIVIAVIVMKVIVSAAEQDLVADAVVHSCCCRTRFSVQTRRRNRAESELRVDESVCVVCCVCGSR